MKIFSSAQIEHFGLSFNQNRVSCTAYTVKNNQANVHEANLIS